MRLVTGEGLVDGPLAAPWRADLALEWEGPVPDRVTLGGAEVPLRGGRAPLPCIEGELIARRGEEVLRARVEAAPGQRPDAGDVELLRTWAVLARKLGPKDGPGLIKLPLLAMETLLQRLQPTALDELLHARGRAAISRIAARPRSYIRTEDERLPVERVARPARDAERDLSRSGAAMRIGRRVVPQQLLSSYTEEDLEIYENRVLITVVKRLRDRALRRRAQASDARDRIGELRASLYRLLALHQFRRHGELEERTRSASAKEEWLQDVEGDAATFLERMDGQLQTYEAALSRPVGLALRRAPLVRAPLRETNILSFDEDYGLLPVIWRLLEREEHPIADLRVDDPEGVYADLCQVGLARALDELRFTLKPSAAELWSAGGTGMGAVEAEGEQGEEGRWIVRAQRGRDPRGWRMDVDVIWRSAAPKTSGAAPRRRTPGAAVADSRQAKPDETVHRLRLRPTFAAATEAAPPVVDGDEGRRAVWLHPVGQLPEAGAEARARFNLSTEPAGQDLPLSVAVHPGDWASADRLGRLIRRFTLWTELERGRVPTWCPCCGGESRGDVKSRSCMAASCGARWGLRDCNTCRAPIPKLLPVVPPSHALDDLLLAHEREGRKRQLFAELGGRDMLADWPLQDGLLPELDTCGDMLACPRCGAS